MSDVSNFEQMVAEFKSMAELQTYANAQYKTIIELTRKINELKDKNEHLVTVTSTGPAVIQFPSFNLSPEEEICLKQLHDLNLSSKTRELTLEEAKKTEIYSKILTSIRSKSKDIEVPKDMTEAELIKLAGSSETI